jgi:hypothetical protein
MPHLNFRTEVAHRLLPERAMVRRGATMPINGQQVGVFVDQGVSDAFLRCEKIRGERDLPFQPIRVPS